MPRTKSRQRARMFRATLRDLRPGHGMRFPLPGAQPSNRIAYQQINGAAYALWGPGSYKLVAESGAVLVVRKAEAADG